MLSSRNNGDVALKTWYWYYRFSCKIKPSASLTKVVLSWSSSFISWCTQRAVFHSISYATQHRYKDQRPGSWSVPSGELVYSRPEHFPLTRFNCLNKIRSSRRLLRCSVYSSLEWLRFFNLMGHSNRNCHEN